MHIAFGCSIVNCKCVGVPNFSLHPDWTPSQIKNYLESTAIDLGSIGKDNTYGSGLVWLPELNTGDGGISLKTYNGKYLCAERGGGSFIIANRNRIGCWEKFKIIDLRQYGGP